MERVSAVFLDRDGVINFDSPDYIKSCEELFFIPGSIEAISELSQKGNMVLIITNQSVIGRKYVSPSGLEKIFNKMKNAVKDMNGEIKDIFFCPHIPQDNCECRKPKPGMFFQARDKYLIDLETSVMVGDSAKDILAAQNAGVGYKILVKTGNGEKAFKELKNKNIAPNYFARNLMDAKNWIRANTEIL